MYVAHCQLLPIVFNIHAQHHLSSRGNYTGACTLTADFDGAANY
jgi:hypothetical protein